MALKSNKTTVAVKTQAVQGTFAAPSSSTDVLPVSNLSLSIQGVTIANNEYTGTIHKNGDEVSGKVVTGSFSVNLRPPGGADVPLADAFIPGRLLKAAKFTELRTAAAIPAAAEAFGAGSTNRIASLGVSAAATENLYKGMPIIISNNGAAYKQQLTAIRSYTAAKQATLAEELDVVPAGTYQIPKSLSYMRSVDETDPPFVSLKVWLDGLRFDLLDVRISGLRWVLPVSTREQSSFPVLEFNFTATILATADEPTPTVPSLGATPFFKDGKLSLAYKKVGGSNVTVDFGLSVAYPPNPNEVDGSGAGELVESKTSLTMDRWAYLKAQFDTLALADAQAQHPLLAQWGFTPGAMVQVVIPDTRFNYQSPDLGGEFVTENGDLFVDVFDRSAVINFPF